MWVCFSNFGLMITGLFSPQYTQAALELGPIRRSAQAYLAARHRAGRGRHRAAYAIMRANLLDELNKPYA